jgi:choline kinase
MRVILLAAGMATRLKPLTDTLPKCLLEVAGKSIVSRAVRILADHGLRRFTLVDGHCGDLLRDRLTREFPKEWFEFVRNDVYATTNNAYSLFLARYDCAEPMLLSDADILYEPGVITRLLEDARPNRLALRTRGAVGEEEMKVVVDAAGGVADISKQVPVEVATGESVGLEVFSAAFARRLFETLERRMLVEGRTGEFYEASFVELIRAGEQLFPVDLETLHCMEVDTLEDLEHARRIFGQKAGL